MKRLKILQKDENFIIIEKDHDIVINSTESERASVHRQLSSAFPVSINKELQFGFYFPHRLDYSTSGVMCIALSKEACAAASAAFAGRQAKKYYLALVRGHLASSPSSSPILQVEIPLGFETNSTEPPQKMIAYGIKARSAVSRILVLERGYYASAPATKVLLKPLTGRRHQLRVHCHLLGHTIVGDYTYSNKRDVDPPRMFLHAFRLMLPYKHSETVDVMTEDPFCSELLSDWMPVEHLYRADKKAMEYLDNAEAAVALSLLED